jgi:hypothetical protein
VKKLLIGYLVISSVFLHLLIAFFILQFGPAMYQGLEMGNEFARTASGNATNRGIVKDVCVLSEGDHTYNGYAIDYKGQTLYTMGSASQNISVGDEVGVSITKHPYAPIKDLMVVVVKNGLPADTVKPESQ